MAQAHMTDATADGGRQPRLGSSAPDGDERGGSGPRRRFRWERAGMWRRGIIIATLAVGVALLMMLHSSVPNRIGNLGSLLETFLPWVGLTIPALFLLGLLRRSATAMVALLLPAVVWLNLFGGLVGDKKADGGDLTVLTHNVNADNLDPVGTAEDLVASGADVVALEELEGSQVDTYGKALAETYPYHSVQGTVGLWSTYPVSGVRAVDIKLGWTRAMRAVVGTPQGNVAFYVAHLPSVRVNFNAGFTARQRDMSADALGEAISDEPLDDVILMGDLNGALNDRSLAGISSQMRSTQGAAGAGFGFSWPVRFPMARIDQILVRGVEPSSSWLLPATGSDHLPVAASVKV